MGRQHCSLAAPELPLLKHSMVNRRTPWPGLFSFTWTCFSTDLYMSRASITLILRVPQTEPHPAKIRGLRFRHPVMLMHKGWNDVCTASLCVLQWFMWLCDLNINFCECLTAQVFRDQIGKQIHHMTSYPHLYGTWVTQVTAETSMV